VNVDDLVVTEFDPHLANRFQEWQRFDIADRATNLDKTNISIAITFLDAFLDLIRDVRNNLHRRAEVIATAFLGDDALVNPARRVVAVAPAFGRSYESFVVAKVKIGLRAIVRHEYLAMLERTHRARIHVDVWVQLDHADRESARFEDRAKTGRCDALPEGRNHAAGDKNI